MRHFERFILVNQISPFCRQGFFISAKRVSDTVLKVISFLIRDGQVANWNNQRRVAFDSDLSVNCFCVFSECTFTCFGESFFKSILNPVFLTFGKAVSGFLQQISQVKMFVPYLHVSFPGKSGHAVFV